MKKSRVDGALFNSRRKSDSATHKGKGLEDETHTGVKRRRSLSRRSSSVDDRSRSSPQRASGLSLERAKNLRELAVRLRMRFRRLALLDTALTHPSYCAEVSDVKIASNQRLEFLGDSVLGLAISQHLYERFPEMDEGELTRIKAVVVSEPLLYAAAQKISLGEHMLLGRGEEQGGGRLRASTLADAFESVVGAVYFEKGMQRTSKFIIEQLSHSIDLVHREEFVLDYKSRLQEFTQERSRVSPNYRVVRESGPDHSKTFEVEVRLRGRPIGKGKGASKKEAEQDAAKEALTGLRNRQEQKN